MIDSLLIKNFRLFDELSIPKLGRVNLIVGENNCGKSSILEALAIFASQGDRNVLFELLGAHNENLSFDDPLSGSTDDLLDTSFRHFFPARRFPDHDGQAIYIGELDSESGAFVKLEHRLFFDEIEDVTDEDGSSFRRRKRIPVSKDQLFKTDTPSAIQDIHLSTHLRSFWLDIGEGNKRRGRLDLDQRAFPYIHVSTDFIPADRLAGMWDRIALTDAAEYVIQALNIIEPDVTGITFVKKPNAIYRATLRDDARVAIVKLTGMSSPVPLASMGDGMTRLLQIVLALFSAKGGFLLLDEVENGLHFSVQKQAWDLVFRLAHDLNVQVFATTHSSDCIKTFSKASIDDTNEEGVAFRLGKSVIPSDNEKVIATIFDEHRLARLANTDFEIR